LLLLATVLLLPSGGQAQKSGSPKRVLVLYWYARERPGNIDFDRDFQATLQSSASGAIEVYSEYLESNRFPGESQSLLLRDYLRRKYAGRTIDVLVATAPVPLDFLFKHRDVLFPDSPIVFAGIKRPTPMQIASGSGATGILNLRSHRRTLDLALKLHPGTEQVFVISGTIGRDKEFETVAREELQGYESKVPITYLTDLPLGELLVQVKSLPERSIILYFWQQLQTQQNTVIESPEILSSIAHAARVPIYGLSASNIGRGVVGGYVSVLETTAAKLGELTRRIINGARAVDIPIERAPEIPTFDWRQLQRWGISEDRLPPGSVVRFRELTMWQQYKSRIVAAIVLFGLQALLIGALLVERHRARRTRGELEQYKGKLQNLVQERTAELVIARDQALAANRSKSMFLAKMSHELRTPLNAILGFSGIVRADPSLSEQHRKDLGIVGSSGEHLLGLIDEVLDMAKIETGGSTVVESASIDLHKLVNESVNMLREGAEAKNLELLLDISSRAPQFVRSDPGKLRQVLTNLVGNALKYTDEGSVVVRVDARSRDNSPDVVLIFDVEDTGIGISEEDQALIFDPFVQAGSARTRKGTGLGLSICRHFVQLLGGTIHVESTLGRGSRFHFELPAQVAEPSEVMAESAGPEQVIGLESGQPDYRILIVEDQRENWLLLQRLLQTAGFQVRVAEDGGQAIETFTMWRPHFIWMDLRIPVLGGLEAARRIRELEGGREVKIAAVTASAFASQRDEVIAAGFDDFLRKPYRSKEIFDCMALHLGIRYVYGAGPKAEISDLTALVRPEDLAALPAALRDELENAVISLDPARIGVLIRQVSEQNALLGKALERLTHKFAYSPILHALRSSGERFKEAGAGQSSLTT
jgi:signal transduction histidine kinase/CheY-like chemotaxis protein